jgi:hypothetical protein
MMEGGRGHDLSVRAPFGGESGRFFSFSMAGSFAGNGGMM